MMSDTLHGNWSHCGDGLKAVADSALPEPAKQLIERVVRRTRLWRRERGEVAMELLSHFADGLDAGRNADDLIATFGNERRAAKLIRRGKRRNRPMWWHVQHRLGQGFALFVVIYVLTGIGLLFSHPNPSVDYLAQVNIAATLAKPEDSAWPIYRDAWTADNGKWLDDMKVLDAKDTAGVALDRMVAPGDAGWPAAVEFLHQHQPLLDALRTVAGKRHLGLVLRINPDEYSPADRKAMFLQFPPTSPALQHRSNERAIDQSMISLLLPYLQTMRSSARLLMEDQKLAAAEADANRVLADYAAALAIGRHARETPLLINQLVAIACVKMADEHLVRLLQTQPAMFAGHEAELAHQMAQAGDTFDIDFSAEKAGLLDVIQRIYTDDGHGGGHITADMAGGLDQFYSTDLTNGKNIPNAALTALVLPAAAAIMADRATLVAAGDRFYAAAQTEAATPYWLRRRQTTWTSDAMVRQLTASQWSRLRFAVLAVLQPAIGRPIENSEQMREFHQAVMTVVAIQAFHHQQGHYPAILAELTPHYLPAVPLDIRTGGPLSYCLKDGQPILYGRGEDDQDHGGVCEKPHRWPNMQQHGDWVFFPPPPEQ